VLLEPHEVVAAAAAILRVFIDHGDRTDRRRGRAPPRACAWQASENP
jgi:sulfite reductase beta subunit-like hemoprotein